MSWMPLELPGSKNSFTTSCAGYERRSRSLSLRRAYFSRLSRISVRSSSPYMVSFSTMPSHREHSPNRANSSCWQRVYRVILMPLGQRMSNLSRGMCSLGTQLGGMSSHVPITSSWYSSKASGWPSESSSCLCDSLCVLLVARDIVRPIPGLPGPFVADNWLLAFTRSAVRSDSSFDGFSLPAGLSLSSSTYSQLEASCRSNDMLARLLRVSECGSGSCMLTHRLAWFQICSMPRYGDAVVG
mmetsp:Transcript_15823/g.44270  ORF Transcript_15823/g.44270 Transcript_15823/m.44270 type:complete len:242 (+) Transcript_15823:1203-1928(+)